MQGRPASRREPAHSRIIAHSGRRRLDPCPARSEAPNLTCRKHDNVHSTAGNNCALKMFHSMRKLHPGVLRLLEYGHRWRGEVRISERSDRKDVCVRSGISFPIPGCSAVGAEIEANLPSGLSIPIEDLCVTFDRHLSLREASNAGCQRPSPPLACLAVTYGDQQRFAGCYRT